MKRKVFGIFAIILLANTASAAEVEGWRVLKPVVDWSKGTIEFYKTEGGNDKPVTYDNLEVKFPKKTHELLFGSNEDLTPEAIEEKEEKLKELGLYGMIDALDKSIASSDTVKRNTANIAENKAAIAEKADKSFVDDLDLKLTVTDARSLANREDIDKNKAAIAEKADKVYVDDNFVRVDDKVATVDTKAATNREDIDKNKVAIAENGKNIKVNEEKINNNMGEIAVNRASIGNNSRRINELDKKSSSGIASVAAMSMVDSMNFGPAGTVNVGAGVGGFNSTAAVAVGVGYIPVEGLSVSAKVALNPGKAKYTTYGAGVNYRFQMK